LFAFLVQWVRLLSTAHFFPDSFSPGATPLITSFVWLALLLPGLGVLARRLHDTDHSGWWILLVLTALIGWIVLIVWCAKRGTIGSNRFGPDPLASPV